MAYRDAEEIFEAPNAPHPASGVGARLTNRPAAFPWVEQRATPALHLPLLIPNAITAPQTPKCSCPSSIEWKNHMSHVFYPHGAATVLHVAVG